jgi:hypothetical protein
MALWVHLLSTTLIKSKCLNVSCCLFAVIMAHAVSPFPGLRRNYPAYNFGSHRTLRDIHVGEEILTNYLDFDDEYFEANLREVIAMCSGTDDGSITKYEEAHAHR